MSQKLKLDHSLKDILVQIIYSHTSNQKVTHNLILYKYHMTITPRSAKVNQQKILSFNLFICFMYLNYQYCNKILLCFTSSKEILFSLPFVCLLAGLHKYY